MKQLCRLSAIKTFVFFFCISSSSLAQIAKNASAEFQYKKNESTGAAVYQSKYQPGYVIIKDGTKMEGKISLYGKSFNDILKVHYKSNNGDRYSFYLRSLKEYGLAKGVKNATPELFSWSDLSKIGLKGVITGYNSYGYVKTVDGRTLNGSITVRESNKKLKSVEVKNIQNVKTKFEPEEVESFGVQVYLEPKAKGSVTNVVRWQPKTGDWALQKTLFFPGYLITADGNRLDGNIQLARSGRVIKEVAYRPIGKGKKVKYDINSLSAYGVEQYPNKDFSWMSNPNIKPEQKFINGFIRTNEGELKTGLIAVWQYEVLYAADENSIVESYAKDNLDDYYQNIDEKVLAEYNKIQYESTHLLGYKLMDPVVWDVKSKNSQGGFDSNYQTGYLKLNSGEILIGALMVDFKSSKAKYYMQLPGKEPVKYGGGDVKEYGLIDNQPSTAFSQDLFVNEVFGFVQLIGSNEKISGALTIKIEKRKGFHVYTDDTNNKVMNYYISSGGETRTFPAANVRYYGLTDVPVTTITGNGLLVSDTDKENFNPGSFILNGEKQSGFVAWLPANPNGEYYGFYFASEMDGVANVYYLNETIKDVIQDIAPKMAAYNPIEATYFNSQTIQKDVNLNGYVIKANGEKMEGSIQMSFAPKLWFASECIITTSDGTETTFSNDPEIKKIVLDQDGKKQEFINFENEYVEVLQRSGDKVHFRNPHPTTPSRASEALNFLTEMAKDAIVDAVAEEMVNQSLGALQSGNTGLFYSMAVVSEVSGNVFDNVTWLNSEVFDLKAKEFLVFDEERKTYAMYIPNVLYEQLSADLMGCSTYLGLSKDRKKMLKKMDDPKATMSFLSSCDQ